MTVAQFLDAALGFAQPRGFRLEVYPQACDFTRIPFARTGGLAPFLQPQQVLRHAQLLLQAMVLPRHLGLKSIAALFLATAVGGVVIGGQA